MRCKGFSFYHQSLGRLQNSQSALNAPPPWPVPGAQAHAVGWGPRGTPRMRAGQQNRGLKDILWRATLQTSITVVTSGKIRILLAFLTLIGGGGGRGSQVALMVKNPPADAGDIRDTGSIPGSGRSSGGGYGNPLQYFCLESPMDRGSWTTVHRVTKNQTQLKQLSTHTNLFYDFLQNS